jgi:hypothetical protein
MKILKFIILAWPAIINAKTIHPPQPLRGPAPPPGLPIDQYLFLLFIFGIVLIFIHKFKFERKK